MDIEDLRENIIKISGLINDSSIDNSYVFFYDETNNIRKLYIRDDKTFNSEPIVFVLGGIVYKNNQVNFDELKNLLKIQKSNNDIKLKHIAKGEFPEIISSIRIKKFLEWFDCNNLWIHYLVIDSLYWSITDIIDSLIGQDSCFDILDINKLKSDLLVVVKEDIASFISLCCKYRYPAIEANKKNKFLDELSCLIKKANNLDASCKTILEEQVLQGKNIVSLPFIEGFKKENLIDNLSPFYFNRLIVFKNSNHIFDEETSIQKIFETDSYFMNNLVHRKYTFKNSKVSIEIQISDIWVGIIGKIFTYLCNKTIDDIKILKKNLPLTGQENLNLIKKIILKSEKQSKMFFQNILSINEIEKFNSLLNN